MSHRRVMLAFLLLLGFCLRLEPALTTEYWLDEVQNWRNAEGSLFRAVFEGNQQDPPLWNLLFWLALRLLRRPWFPRLLSVLAGTWGLWLFWRCSRRAGAAPFASFLALALLALNPLHAILSADVKHYAFSTSLLLFHLLCLEALGRASEADRVKKRRWVVLSIAALAWTNYLSLFQVLVSLGAYVSWRGFPWLRTDGMRELRFLFLGSLLLVLPLALGILPRQVHRWVPSSASDWRAPAPEYPLRVFRRAITADRRSVNPAFALLVLLGAMHAWKRRTYMDRVFLGAWLVHLPLTLLCLARWQNLFSMRYFLFEAMAAVHLAASGVEACGHWAGRRFPEHGRRGIVVACLLLGWPLFALGRNFLPRFLEGQRSEWQLLTPLLRGLHGLKGLQSLHVFPYWMDQVVAFRCYELGFLPWGAYEIDEILHRSRSLDDGPGDPSWKRALDETERDELLCLRRRIWERLDGSEREELTAAFAMVDAGGDFLLLARRNDKKQLARLRRTYPHVPLIKRFENVSVYEPYRLEDFRDFARRLLPGEILLLKPGHMNRSEFAVLDEKLVFFRLNPYLLMGVVPGKTEQRALVEGIHRRHAGRELNFQP